MAYEAKQAIYLPVTDYLSLEFFLMETRPGVKPGDFIVELVQRWLAAEKARLALRSGLATRGFQWKNVFLPEGTTLRTSHRDKVEFAKVVGDRILYQDETPVTPSMFANRCTGGRNAWRFIWLRFPASDHWVRADNCRKHAKESEQRQSKTALAVV